MTDRDAATASHRSGDEISVLHVDDEPDFADLMGEFLEREDERIRVETATSTSEGLERLAEAEYDCVVSDYDMPGPSGIDFLERVRESYPDLPFILFTGKGSEEVASEAISAGVTDYLQKETGHHQFSVLANKLLNAVQQRRTQAALLEEQRQHAALFNNFPEPTVAIEIVDGEPILRAVNPAFERTFGFDADTAIGESLNEIIVPEGAMSEARELDRRARQGDPIDEELRRDTVDGTRDFHLRSIPVEGEIDFYGVYEDVTERNEREQQLRALFDNSATPIAYTEFEDDEPIVRDVNAAFEETFGYAVEAAIGRNLDELVVPGEKRSEAETINQRVEMGEQFDVEVRRETTDGLRDFLLQSVPVQLESSGERSYAVYRDITARKERERSLRQLKEEYETVFETAQDAIFQIDVEDGDEPEFTFTRLNPAHEAISGLSSAEIRGQTPREVLGPELGAEVAARYASCVEAMEPISYVEELEMPAGTIDWHTKLGPVVRNGEVTQIVGVARDITDQQKRERELERYEAIVENSEDGIYVFDEDGRFDFVNQRVAEVSGIPREEFIGEHLSVLADFETITQEELAEVEAAIEAILTGDATERRVRLRPDLPHELRDLELRMTALEREDPSRVIGFSRDITEHRAHERELERKNERLDEFASFVSHDLRNPLNVVSGRLELAQDECDSEHLDAIGRATQRMENLIEDLLDLARGSGEIEDLQAVELGGMLDTCWSNLGADDATLEVDTRDRILADESRLQQLLENLLRNAVEHGGEDVTIRIGTLDAEDGFYVEDDGDGIPEAERDRVFETGISSEPDGTGFGLSIVREIVDAHGWDIRVTDSDDGGARFEITGVELAA